MQAYEPEVAVQDDMPTPQDVDAPTELCRAHSARSCPSVFS